MANVFCRNINHVAMDFLKTYKMEMNQIYYNFRSVIVISFIVLIFHFAKFAARFAMVHRASFLVEPKFPKDWYSHNLEGR